MDRKWLLAVGAVDLFILSSLDKLAFRYFLYWKYAWFDVLMHLFGGLAVGLLSSWAYLELKAAAAQIDPHSWRGLFSFNLIFALVIGLIWEMFEVFADRLVVFNWFDSGKDVVVGMIGSLLAGLIVGGFKLRSNFKKNIKIDDQQQ
jgi:hypothetical protein